MSKSKDHLTWAQVDTKAIKHNIAVLNRLAQKNKFLLPTRPNNYKRKNSVELMPVIKADAYGHGMKEVAAILDQQGIKRFAVSDLKEGKLLRNLGFKQHILLFESTLPTFAQDILDYQLTPTVCTLELAQSLNRLAKKSKRRLSIHIKIDTGMGRLGVWYEQAHDFVRQLQKLHHLVITGIYTHFPVADTNKTFTSNQIKKLFQLILTLDQNALVIPYIHASNSMGLMGYKTSVLNLARPGLLLYGLSPSVNKKNVLNLKPALSVKSTVIYIKTLERGRGVSYGQKFIAKKRMKVATIPIGYQDGYFRSLSNKAYVLIGGCRCPLLGHVTMDQIVVDITKVKDSYLGMPVVILGSQKKQTITAEELAKHADTINYEIVCALGARLPKVHR